MSRNSLASIIITKSKLLRKRKRKAIAFDLNSIGELQFFRNILERYLERNPDSIVLIVHHQDTENAFDSLMPSTRDRVCHVRNDHLRMGCYNEINMFVTTEQYDLGVNGVYSICLFHGQPSKGLTFTEEIVSSFDAFFLYGKLHHQALREFKEETVISTGQLRLYDIGYSKSDDLINGKYVRKEVLKELGLDENKKTILYAPAFNEYASLREYGKDIIRLLAEGEKYNVIVKLPIDCNAPTTNYYATGGIDWFGTIASLSSEFGNVRLYREYQIDSVIACSDVLVTCVSSVSFEFFAVNKPVIFINTPKFFTHYLKSKLPGKNTESWENRTTVNGGREFGIVVKDLRELTDTISYVLDNPELFPKQKEFLRDYLLFNPGKASQVAVETIEKLLCDNMRPSRRVKCPNMFISIIIRLIKSVKNRL